MKANKVGIMFGTFAPMHQGHMDLIMKAKKVNDKCFVLCSGFNGDRGEDIGLTLQKRYEYTQELFDGDEQIVTEKMNDDDLGLDQSMSPNNWKVWTNAVFDLMSKYSWFDWNETDFTWYVSEWFYKESLENLGYKVEYTTRSHLSATIIRENPIRYWNDMAITFRRHFSRNILITGTASEGKTTLVNDISRYFGIPKTYEKGRDNCKFKVDSQFDRFDFMYNLYEQNKAIREAIESPANPGVMISDTDNLVTLMYAKAYAEKKDFVLSPYDYEHTLMPMAQAYNSSVEWDRIFLIKPSEGFTDDGTRWMDDGGMETRERYYRTLKLLILKFGWGNQLVELDGDYFDNYVKVRGYIENIF